MKAIIQFSILSFCLVFFQNCKKTTVAPTPTVMIPHLQNNSKGCGDFQVAQIINDNYLMIVRFDYNKINFKTDWQVFDDVSGKDFVTVELVETCNPYIYFQNFCNDGIKPIDCGDAKKWELKKAKVSFKVDNVLPKYGEFVTYKASVIVENADFQDLVLKKVKRIDKMTFTDVLVGWEPG
jgi:hypothetical protein